MSQPDPIILSTSVDVTLRIPVDLSSDLDRPEVPPLLTEHTVTLSIESPHPALVLVNAVAATLERAVRTLVDVPQPAQVIDLREHQPYVVRMPTDDLQGITVEGGPAHGPGVILLPQSAKQITLQETDNG
jgi:hypothetical protein